MTTTAPETTGTAQSTSSCVIEFKDFDHTAQVWARGYLEHIIKLLDGRPVAVVVDKQTGHTEIGVRLVGVAARQFQGYGLVVERTHSDGTVGRTNFSLWSIGWILPLGDNETRSGNVKWKALESYRKASMSVIQQAQAEHPNLYGTWKARCLGGDQWSVTCNRYPHGHAGPPAGWSVPPLESWSYTSTV